MVINVIFFSKGISFRKSLFPVFLYFFLAHSLSVIYSFLENLYKASFYVKEQSSKRKLKIKFCSEIFCYAPKIDKTVLQLVKENNFFLRFSLLLAHLNFLPMLG